MKPAFIKYYNRACTFKGRTQTHLDVLKQGYTRSNMIGGSIQRQKESSLRKVN